MPRLGQCVFYKGGIRLFGLGHPQFALGNHAYTSLRQYGGKFFKLARIIGSQHYFSHFFPSAASLTNKETNSLANTGNFSNYRTQMCSSLKAQASLSVMIFSGRALTKGREAAGGVHAMPNERA